MKAIAFVSSCIAMSALACSVQSDPAPTSSPAPAGEPPPAPSASTPPASTTPASESDCKGEANPARIHATQLLVTIEDGGTVRLDPKTGKILGKPYATGPNAFGAVFSLDGKRAFITDRTAGTLSEIDLKGDAVLGSLKVGSSATSPAITAGNRIYVATPEGIIVVDASGSATEMKIERTISVGAGSKPHIVSVSPDSKFLWASVQGTDPKLVSLELTNDAEAPLKEFRFNGVPRVVDATNSGVFFTAYHSVAANFIALSDGKFSTKFADLPGSAGKPEEQIERVTADSSGSLLAMSAQARKALVIVKTGGEKPIKRADLPLADIPYWVSFDPSNEVVYVTVPSKGLVEAYDAVACSTKPLWSTKIEGKAKRTYATDDGASLGALCAKVGLDGADDVCGVCENQYLCNERVTCYGDKACNDANDAQDACLEQAGGSIEAEKRCFATFAASSASAKAFHDAKTKNCAVQCNIP